MTVLTPRASCRSGAYRIGDDHAIEPLALGAGDLRAPIEHRHRAADLRGGRRTAARGSSSHRVGSLRPAGDRDLRGRAPADARVNGRTSRWPPPLRLRMDGHAAAVPGGRRWPGRRRLHPGRVPVTLLEREPDARLQHTFRYVSAHTARVSMRMADVAGGGAGRTGTKAKLMASYGIWRQDRHRREGRHGAATARTVSRASFLGAFPIDGPPLHWCSASLRRAARRDAGTHGFRTGAAGFAAPSWRRSSIGSARSWAFRAACPRSRRISRTGRATPQPGRAPGQRL